MGNMTCKGIRYVIQQGDSLYKISRIYRVPLTLLLRANPYVDVYNLQVGDELCIPLLPQPVPRNQEEGSGRMPELRTGVMPEEIPETVPRVRQGGRVGGNTGVVPENMSGGRPEAMPENGQEETEEAMMIYVVQTGDTLEGLLERFALSLEDFLRYNQPGIIQLVPGSTVEIPQSRLDR